MSVPVQLGEAYKKKLFSYIDMLWFNDPRVFKTVYKTEFNWILPENLFKNRIKDYIFSLIDNYGKYFYVVSPPALPAPPSTFRCKVPFPPPADPAYLCVNWLSKILFTILINFPSSPTHG